jgi:hypothetical protein
MPQLLDISPDEYHLRPGLSASIAKALMAQSELHAWQQHPSYGAKGKKPTKLMDRGAVLHHLLLGKGSRFAVLPFEDWKKKAAQESRDKAREAGLIPITHVLHSEYEAAAREIRARLDDAGHFISDATGISEAAIEWEESSSYGPVTCRCMMDWLSFETATIFELKIVEDASPDHVERSAETMGYRIGAAAYVRALAALRPELIGSITYRFLFCEPEAPYAIYDPEPDSLFLETGERDWLRAVEKWARCVSRDEWPNYAGAGSISRPSWALRREGYLSNG